MTEHRSLLEIAVDLMEQKSGPQKLVDFAKEVCEISGKPNSELDNIIAKLYTDMTTSSLFVYTGEEEFNLKSRELYSLYQKDSSHFQEGVDDYVEELKAIEERDKVQQEKVIVDTNNNVKIEDSSFDYNDDTTIYNDYEESSFDKYIDEEEYDEMMDEYEDLYND